MDKPMPEITCPKCNLAQIWRGQKNCIHRGCEWSNWFRANLMEALEQPIGVRRVYPTAQG